VNYTSAYNQVTFMSRTFAVAYGILLVASLAAVSSVAQTQSAQPQAHATAQSPQAIPVMDGEAGPCSLDLTVTSADRKPVYAAIIKVHMAYGFGGIRRLDLQAGTNSDGKVRFVGLPSRVRRPPLEFQATKDQLVGMTTFDPGSECQGKHNLVMETPKAATTN